jgi:pSer/pThr/pTyr-binding forkhead associated (FHA) protein
MSLGCPLCGKTLTKEEILKMSSPLSLCPHCQGPIERPALIPVSPAAEQVVTDRQGAPRETPPAGKKFVLEVLDGNEPGKTFPIEKGRITVGRKNCDVHLSDPEISRQHVALTIQGDGAILEDLKSANGTYVLGQRIERVELKPGDTFRLGTHQLVFLEAD